MCRMLAQKKQGACCPGRGPDSVLSQKSLMRDVHTIVESILVILFVDITLISWCNFQSMGIWILPIE